MESNHITVTATIQFDFTAEDDTTLNDIITEIEDRIRCGEYFPHNVIDVDINALRLIRKGA